ncbi:tautomerase family protein [Paraburkholderia steynii]|uniref:Tautomerase family protein n=1 Tax=Paraburkholderia steynii TaxID=1245441 RepID=A0A4R0X8U1_9BURK|nr:tautomerase family protein [Paraburkholderia steynii]
MPLVKFDVTRGRTDEQLKILLDASHRAMLRAFGVPERDRYQIIAEHDSSRWVIEDTGLGIPRTPDVVVVTVMTRPRSTVAKQMFYRELVQELQSTCGIEPSDVVVNIVTNSDEDWRFGNGLA